MDAKKETYSQLYARQQKETDDFPMFFAFSKEQFEKGMREFGLTHDDTDKIYKLGDSGGYILKTEGGRLSAMFERHDTELTEAMTDIDFAAEAFRYQLNNHEFRITHDRSDALLALGLTGEDLANNKTLNAAFAKAEKQYLSDYGEREKRLTRPQTTMLDRIAKNQKKVDEYKEANPPGNGKDRNKSVETLG